MSPKTTPKRKILIVYESRHGQTAKIAGALADTVGARGVEALALHVGNVPPDLDLAGYDLVAVGASIHFGRHPKSVAAFVRDRLDALEATPTAFFSVSGHAIDGTSEGDATARGYVDQFLAGTGWSPDRIARFAGGVPYTRYNIVLRFVMKKIQEKAGRSTDTSRDHEYTDWGAVEDFGRELVRIVAVGSGARPG